jgi:uncharacterized protein (DUF1015 family)
MLNIDNSKKECVCLDYIRDAAKAVNQVKIGVSQLVFLLRHTPISSVLAVADDGEEMPQKSTYFHPKTPAGLIINPLWNF